MNRWMVFSVVASLERWSDRFRSWLGTQEGAGSRGSGIKRCGRLGIPGTPGLNVFLPQNR